MKVSVGRDSENSLKIVTVPLKSGLLATMSFNPAGSKVSIATRRCKSANTSSNYAVRKIVITVNTITPYVLYTATLMPLTPASFAGSLPRGRPGVHDQQRATLSQLIARCSP